jgi:phospholipid N-methyltransferase
MADAKGPVSEPQLFWRQFKQNFFEMGAVLPSSRALAQAAAAYLARKEGPGQVLEVGAGTGAFTGEIVPLLQPGDSLDIVEINPDLMTHLKQRFRQDSDFQTRDVEINFLNEDIRRVSFSHNYDYIIFSLPLTNFPPDMVQEILTLMLARLKPGGIFSYVKYIFLGRLKYLFGGRVARANAAANQEIIRSFASQYQFERRAVWLNVPPAWTYYWQKPKQVAPQN